MNEGLCEVCANDSFSFVDGQWTCSVCYTVSNRRVDEAQDSGDGSAGRNYSRIKRSRVAELDENEERPMWSYAFLFQRVLKAQLAGLRGVLEAESVREVERAAKGLWFRFVEQGGLWSVSEMGQHNALTLRNVECTLYILFAAIRMAGVDLLASRLVDLVYDETIPLYDPLSWFQRNYHWQPSRVPLLDSRQLLAFAPKLPPGSARMNRFHWKALLGPGGHYHASACELLPRVICGAFDVCSLCKVPLPQPPAATLLSVAERDVIAHINSDAEKAHVRKHLEVIAKSELRKNGGNVQGPFPEGLCAAVLAVIAAKMVTYADAEGLLDRMLDALQEKPAEMLWRKGESSSAKLRSLIASFCTVVGLQDEEPKKQTASNTVPEEEERPLTLAAEYVLNNRSSAFPDAALLLIATYVGKVSHCIVSQIVRSVRRVEQFSSTLSASTGWHKLVDRVLEAEEAGSVLTTRQVRDVMSARKRVQDFALPLNWNASRVMKLKRDSGTLVVETLGVVGEEEEEEDEDEDREVDRKTLDRKLDRKAPFLGSEGSDANNPEEDEVVSFSFAAPSPIMVKRDRDGGAQSPASSSRGDEGEVVFSFESSGRGSGS